MGWLVSILNQSWGEKARKVSQIWTWLRRGRAEPQAAEPALKGAPVRPRTKTYSAQTGFVYQYVYRGYRLAEQGRDYVFVTKRDRIHDGLVTIRLLDVEFAECSRKAGRQLLDSERYAISKMTLFEAFDDGGTEGAAAVLQPDAEAMERHLRTLGRIA